MNLTENDRSVLNRIKETIDTLNDDQAEAITSTEGPLLIIAGPGTGKTLTIVARTLFLLISERARPEEIILTTFTEKAAFELRDRVSQLGRKIGYQGRVNQLKVGTIHSLCNQFIMDFLHKTWLNKNYRVLDELTQVFFVYEHFDVIAPLENGQYLGKWDSKWRAINTLISYLNKITEELIEPTELRKSEDPFLFKVAEAYERYVHLLYENNTLDFSHLQKIFFELLQDKDTYKKIKGKIKYIMVDEYQDTNYVQEQILLTLARPENNLCVVGDEDQALYRFRGATVRNILEFSKNFDNCKEVKLTINYRSHRDIISRCNKFITSIDWDGFRHQKEIKENPGGEFPAYPAVFSIWAGGPEDEARRFVQLIKFLKDNKIIQDWSDVALLLRSVRPEHSGHYIQALKDNHIPYFAPRAKMFFENEEVKFLIACYALIFGFHSNELADYPHRQYVEESISLLGRDGLEDLKDYIRRKVKQIEELETGSLDLTILDYFYQLLAYKPFSFFLKDENKAYNLSIFSRLISIFQAYYGVSLVSARDKGQIKYRLFNSFFNFLITNGMDEYEDPDNPVPKGFVQIMTIHQSKGLEFPVVVVGTLEKTFKVQKEVDRKLLPFSKRGTYETEEQMTRFDRLRHYYVAFTRAQKILVLTAATRPLPWFNPVWEGLDQYPYIEDQTLKAQKFSSKPQFIPKKSYSLSQVNAYEICPQQYLFFKEYDFQPSRSAQVLFGSLVHQTIEDIHKAVLDRETPSTDLIENWFEKNYKALLLAGLRPLSKTLKETALKQVLNYFEQNMSFLQRLKEAEVDVSLEKEDYIIVGKVDLLLAQDEGLELLDFKTQKKPDLTNDYGKRLVQKYLRQLCLYAHIINNRYNIPVKKMYIYWTSEEKRKDALAELNYCDQDVEDVGRYFDEIVRKIKQKDFSLNELPDVEKVCKECDFRFYCSENGIIKFKTKELMEE